MDITNQSKSETKIASALNTIELSCLLNLSHIILSLCKFSENCAILVGFRMDQRNCNEIL